MQNAGNTHAEGNIFPVAQHLVGVVRAMSCGM